LSIGPKKKSPESKAPASDGTMRHRSSREQARQVSSASALSRDASTDHYSDERKHRSHKKALKITLITVACVLVCAVGGVWAYLNNISSQLNSGVDDSLRGQLTETTGSDPFYILLLGVDKSQDRAEGDEYGPSDSAYRSDSMMLVRVDPQNKQVTLVSLHRDTLIDFGSDGGKQKLNAAYSIGGPSYCVQTVSKFAGVPISHYAELDFDSFCAIVDQIGGIEVDVPVDVYDPEYTGADIKAGVQTVNGDQALQLCRARHAYDNYGDGDLYRAANQRMVIAAIVKKVLTLDTASMASTVSTMAGSVTTDMSVTDILSLANEMRGLDVDNNVYSGMEPTNSEYVNNTWYEICDTTAWQKMMTRVDEGLSPYEDSSDDPTQGVAGGTDNTKNEGATTDSDTSSSTSSSTTSSTTGTSSDIDVLNAAGVQGIAAKAVTTLEAQGLTATASNASSHSATSKVMYASDEYKDEAEKVASALGGLTVEASDGSYSSSAGVIVILGADQS
jgi:LCP family protein required for cell wall assembly